MTKYIITKCPFCGKEFKAQVMHLSSMYQQVAKDKVWRLYEGHVPICSENPNTLKSASIPLPEYQEVTE